MADHRTRPRCAGCAARRGAAARGRPSPRRSGVADRRGRPVAAAAQRRRAAGRPADRPARRAVRHRRAERRPRPAGAAERRPGQRRLDLAGSGTHTLRVWYAGPDQARLALLGTLGESDMIRNGRDVWIWSSETNTGAPHYLPAGAADRARRADPDCRAARPRRRPPTRRWPRSTRRTEVTHRRHRARSPAGTPTSWCSPRGTTASLVGQVRLAIDAEQHVPLRVQVFAPGRDDAGVRGRRSPRSASRRPDAEQFAFNPPPGAKVDRGHAAGVGRAGRRPSRRSPADAGTERRRTVAGSVGTGWTHGRSSVDAGRAGPRPPDRGRRRAGQPFLRRGCRRVSGDWGSGRLLTVRAVHRCCSPTTAGCSPARSRPSCCTRRRPVSPPAEPVTSCGPRPCDADAVAAVATAGLTKRFPAARSPSTRIDLAVPRGAVYGFLGPNGSGKTTTIRMLLGLIRPTAGTHDPARAAGCRSGAQRVLPRVGALVEGPAFHPYLSGRDNLRRLDAADRTADPAHRATARIAAALDRVGLPAAAGKRYRDYSLGMRQRLGIAAALLQPRELLILDEPTNGLDPQGTREVRALVSGAGRRRRDRHAVHPPAVRGGADLHPRRRDARRQAGGAGHPGRAAGRGRRPGSGWRPTDPARRGPGAAQHWD